MSRSEEARLLYTLLHAAEEEQRIRDASTLEKWLALKLLFDRARAARSHAALLALFGDLERRELFTGTWIEFRWRKAKAQRGQQATGRPSRGGVTHK